jgi:hypothetical protein
MAGSQAHDAPVGLCPSLNIASHSTVRRVANFRDAVLSTYSIRKVKAPVVWRMYTRLAAGAFCCLRLDGYLKNAGVYRQVMKAPNAMLQQGC